jgi:hypothetical protein
MTIPKAFEDYVNEGIIKKSYIDKSRAKYFIEEAQKSFKGMQKRIAVMGIDEENSNSIIKDNYDIIMEIIRANLLIKGYNSQGPYAHEAEISYLKPLGFTYHEISFLNDLRISRNSILYYGKILQPEYAKKVVEFTIEIYPKLLTISLF